MFHFQWNALVTNSLIERILTEAGIDSSVDIAPFRRLVCDIFEAVGGPPVVDQLPSEPEQDAWSFRLFNGALNHTLSNLSVPALNDGFILRTSSVGMFESEAIAMPRVPVNRANQRELEALPAIGNTLADRIVAERRRSGRFMSMDDLISRVQGMGDRAAKELSNILRFDLVEDLVGEMLMVTVDFGVNLRKLMSVQPGGTAAAKLESSLEAITVTCAANRHPHEDAGLQYQMSVPDGESELPTADIRILFGTSYYAVLPELFRLASSSIAVCMFHIALPEESHPTKALLNELVTAKNRGVEVRVLMDADRPSDQYRSTVINTNAKEFLKAEGVLVRFDPPGKLLHSKFIVIDKKLIVLGSHNWSAGSYFQFDDISLIIISDTLAAKQSERFELQWQAGS